MRVHPLADYPTSLRRVDGRDIHGRAVLPLRLALVQVQHLVLDIVDPAELVRIANRPVDWRRCDTQRSLDVVNQRERILGGPIELVDERQNRQPMTPADLEELSRLRLDAVRCVDHHHDAVGSDERAIRIFAEVLMARRVEQRHAPPLNLELERRGCNRNAALLLELHPVGRRGLAILAAANRAGQLDRAGIQQQLLGERRLARVGMRDNGERPAARDLALKLALDGLVENHLRGCPTNSSPASSQSKLGCPSGTAGSRYLICLRGVPRDGSIATDVYWSPESAASESRLPRLTEGPRFMNPIVHPQLIW